MAGKKQEQPQEQQPPEVQQAQDLNRFVNAEKYADFIDDSDAGNSEGIAEATRNTLQAIALPESKLPLADIARALHGTAQAAQENGRKLAQTLSQIIPKATEAQSIFKSIEVQKLIYGFLSEEARQSLKATIEEIESNIYISDKKEEALQIMAELAPYIKAELEEHPELYEGEENGREPAGILYAAAARRAREDGKEIPPLKAELLEFPTQQTEAGEKNVSQVSEISSFTLARNLGAITTLGNRVATIADKNLQQWFASTNLSSLPAENGNFLFDKVGRLNEDSLKGQPLKPLDVKQKGFLMALLQIANTSDIREYNSEDNPSIPVQLPAFFRETKVDPRPRKWDSKTKTIKKRDNESNEPLKEMRYHRFMEFIEPLLNRVGYIPGEGYYTLVNFERWDEKADVSYITIPYFLKLAQVARLHADNHSAISTFFHADILTENQTAVELANRITVGVIERGVKRRDSSIYQNEYRKPRKVRTTKTDPDGTKIVTVKEYSQESPADTTTITKNHADGTITTTTKTQTDEGEIITTITKSQTDENGNTTTTTKSQKKKKPITWHAKFSTLIRESPALQREIDEIRKDGAGNKSQRINKKLSDIFTAAIGIIMEKSDVPQYYADITIRTSRFETFKAPTNSTLNDELIIRHYGKNPNYTD